MKISIYAVLLLSALFNLHTEDYLRLISPNNGWTSKRVVEIRGETSIDARWIHVIYNSVEFLVPINNGVFSRRFVASSGVNTVYVSYTTEEVSLSDSITFYSKAPRTPLKMVLVWDTDGSYVDMWITEPSGEICKWDHQTTKTGGTLDIGNDYPGYGPQIFSHPAPPKGTYLIQAHYYSSGGNPQSQAKVFVIRDEGGPNERTEVYEAMLTRAGQMVMIVSITVE